jgi:hypothetical protein
MSVNVTINARADQGVSYIHVDGASSKYAPSIFLDDSRATQLTIWDLTSAYALHEAANRAIAWYEDRADRDGGPGARNVI